MNDLREDRHGIYAPQEMTVTVPNQPRRPLIPGDEIELEQQFLGFMDAALGVRLRITEAEYRLREVGGRKVVTGFTVSGEVQYARDLRRWPEEAAS